MSTPEKQQVIVLVQDNQLEQAKALCGRLCAENPEDVEARKMLAEINVHRGDLETAAECMAKVVELQPGHAEAHYNLAMVLHTLGHAEESVSHYRKAISIQPDHALVHVKLARAQHDLGRMGEAEQSYRRAIELHPECTAAYGNLANHLWDCRRYGEAEKYYKKALAFETEWHDLRLSYARMLHGLGRLDEALEELGTAMRYKPDLAHAHESTVAMLNYKYGLPAEELYQAHCDWTNSHLAQVEVLNPVHADQPDSDRTLRIGYLSPDLRAHSVARFVEPLLASHNRSVCEIFCYADVEKPDAITAQLRSLVPNWRNTHQVYSNEMVELIRNDKIDILVDLAGHNGGRRLHLFARKPAPIQVSYLGYPNTTGLTTIDYRLTDHWTDPPELSDRFYTETLIRLPNGFLCYRPPRDAPPVAPLPANTIGHITFGSFNGLPKVRDETISRWSEILHNVPGSRILIKGMGMNEPDQQQRYLAQFSRYGVDPKRLDLIATGTSNEEHFATYHRVDICLDTFPYNGTTTTCESLWMGVPVVALAGEMHAGRVGVSLLSRMGLSELIADNEEDYVRVAAELASDTARLADLRTSLRSRMQISALCDGRLLARDIEDAYREMWRKWCQRCAN